MTFHIIRFTILQSAPLLLLVLLSANAVLAMPIATNIKQVMLSNIGPRSTNTLSEIGIKAPPDQYNIQWRRQMAFSHNELIVRAAIYQNLMHMKDAGEEPPSVWLNKLFPDLQSPAAPHDLARRFWVWLAEICRRFMNLHPSLPSPSVRTTLLSLEKAASEQLPLETWKAIDDIHLNFRPETLRLSARAMRPMPPELRDKYWAMILMTAYVKLKQSAALFAELVSKLHDETHEKLPADAPINHLTTQQYWDRVIHSCDRLSVFIDQRMQEAHHVVAGRKLAAQTAKRKGEEPPDVLTYLSELRLRTGVQSRQTDPTGVYGFWLIPQHSVPQRSGRGRTVHWAV